MFCHSDTILTSARQELAAINGALDKAAHERNEAQQAADRLSFPVAELNKAIEQLTAVRAAYDARISAWYADGCPGSRPTEPADLAGLENAVRELTRDGSASRPALEAARNVLDERNVHFSQLAAQKQSAIYRASVEAARERLHRHATPAMIAAMSELSVIESLATVLRNLPYPEAVSASRNIDAAVAAARQSIGLRADLDAARQFLNELADNPEATLPDPGEPIVETLEPRAIRLAEDGSQHINRGPEQEPPPQYDPILEAHYANLRAMSEHLNLPDPVEPPSGWAPTFMPAPGPRAE